MVFRRGQSTLEYVILIVIVIAALLTMQMYMKRGVQGRWKSAADELGEQYDPNSTTINLVFNYDTTSSSEVVVRNEGNWVTRRFDTTTSSEKKTGVWTTPVK
jgi:uncharacterized protein (UPF0333 family)